MIKVGNMVFLDPPPPLILSHPHFLHPPGPWVSRNYERQLRFFWAVYDEEAAPPLSYQNAFFDPATD